MTAAPGLSYRNDILGNRLSTVYSSNGASNYTWDALDRMTGISSTLTAGDSSYTYWADGMRTQKAVTNNAFPPVTTTDIYRHDAQMPFEDEQISGSNVTAVRSILGARGIEAEQTCTGTISGTTRTLSAPTFTYPVYDAHGNRIATLQRGASTRTYTVGSIRYYGAWGEIRVGATTGGSNSRHCAAVGQVQDDESGLIYMRARYYDPVNGRFTNEDSSCSGRNWFCYCGNVPLDYVDVSGNDATLVQQISLATGMTFFGIAAMAAVYGPALGGSLTACSAFAEGACHFGMILMALALDGCDNLYGKDGAAVRTAAGEAVYFAMSQTILKGAEQGGKCVDAQPAVLAGTIYCMVVMAALVANDAEGSG